MVGPPHAANPNRADLGERVGTRGLHAETARKRAASREGTCRSETKGITSGGGTLGETAGSAVTADWERLRPRLLAFTGLWFLLAGLLAALSFVVIVLLASSIVLLVVLAAAAPRLLRRYRIGPRLQTVLDPIERASRRQHVRLGHRGFRQHVRRLGDRVGKLATGAPGRARGLLVRGGRRYAAAAHRLTSLSPQSLQTSRRLPSFRYPRDRRRHAFCLNERGAQLRRAGHAEQAVEQHRVALAIVRDLGDQHAEALTLNSLALALAHGGAETAALQQFEEALVVLRKLGDEEHEGQVIANLGLVHRRQGRSEEAVSLLHAALDKLPPESSAYRRVEQQLSRAS